MSLETPPEPCRRQLEQALLGRLPRAQTNAATLPRHRPVLLPTRPRLALYRQTRLGLDHGLRPAGELWSFVVFHQSYFDGMKDELPYPVAMVKLDEGPYLLTNLAGLNQADVKIGMRLAVQFPGGPGDFVAAAIRSDGMTDAIVVTQHENWAELRINREAKRNAMNREARHGLLQAFDKLQGHVKAIVVTGTGFSFCAGMDLKEVEADRAAGIPGSGEEWINVNLAIRAHPAIFIAAVNGVATRRAAPP